ncbi:MAG: ABC transporter substrate-binding protein [Rhodospirillaceae bacterium]
MIWLKVVMAAVMSGALSSAIGFVLPPRSPQPFVLQLSDWPGDRLFTLIEPLELAPSKRLVPLDIRVASPGQDGVDAFKAGRVDAALVGVERLPELLADEVRLIWVSDEVIGGGALVAAPGVMRVADLGSRPVGIGFGGAGEPLLRALLGRAGLDAARVTLTPLVPEAAGAALKSGAVGAAALLSPARAESLRDALGATLLASTRDLSGVSTHVLVVKEGMIADRREQLVAVLHALSRTVRTCRSAPERCLDLLAASTARPAAAWRGELETIRFLDAADNRALLEGGNTAPLTKRFTAPPPRPAMDWIDPSLAIDAGRLGE